MTMKLLRARDSGGFYRLRVHLDTTKVLDRDRPELGLTAGDPDPAWVREYEWTKDMPLARVKAETKLLCQTELAKLNATGDEGAVLAGEGQAL
jgi:hypothetical protein